MSTFILCIYVWMYIPAKSHILNKGEVRTKETVLIEVITWLKLNAYKLRYLAYI